MPQLPGVSLPSLGRRPTRNHHTEMNRCLVLFLTRFQGHSVVHGSDERVERQAKKPLLHRWSRTGPDVRVLLE
jgi:hypothetical protein